mgnify:FL=1|tara:strand:+ start:135 stop:347 length:213 start_codon:yes stop_codon:yes gene_type:complete
MANTKNSVNTDKKLTRDDIERLVGDFKTNLENQFTHHQTMSVKAQGAMEIMPQIVDVFLKELGDGEESKK